MIVMFKLVLTIFKRIVDFMQFHRFIFCHSKEHLKNQV